MCVFRELIRSVPRMVLHFPIAVPQVRLTRGSCFCEISEDSAVHCVAVFQVSDSLLQVTE